MVQIIQPNDRLRESREVINNNFNSLNVSKANRTEIQGSALTYANTTGTGNDFVVSLTPAPTAYTAGLTINFRANRNNTGTSTLNVNNLGVRTIRKNGTENLIAGDIIQGAVYTAIFDGDFFQIVGGATADAVRTFGDQTIFGVKTFDSPIPSIQRFTYGETIAVNDAVFLSTGTEFISQEINHTPTETHTTFAWGANYNGQTFTTPASVSGGNFMLHSITLRLRRLGTQVGNLVFDLRATASGLPSGAILASHTIPSTTNIPTTTTNITIPINRQVAPNTQFAITWHYQSGNVNQQIISSASENTYTGGISVISTNWGSPWVTNPTRDTHFVCNLTELQTVPANRVYKLNDITHTALLNFVGFAKENGIIGENKAVQTQGIVSGFSQLEGGSSYFISANGGISRTRGRTAFRIGIAINGTSLFMCPDFFVLQNITHSLSPGQPIQWRNDPAAHSSGNAFMLIKEILINETLPMTNISFEHWATNPGVTNSTEANLRINNVSVSSSWNSSATPVIFSFDMTTPLVAGDRLQIFGHGHHPSNGASVRNFRLNFNFAPERINNARIHQTLPLLSAFTINPTNIL